MEDIWSPYRRYRRHLYCGFVEPPTQILPEVFSGVQPRITKLETKCSSGGKTYTASMEFKYAVSQPPSVQKTSRMRTKELSHLDKTEPGQAVRIFPEGPF